MRTKTLNQIAQEAAKYAAETLDIERGCMELFAVSEKLPEKDGSYLVFAPRSFPKNSRFMVAEFYDDNNTFYSECSDQPLPDVTHWAYLPAEPIASNNVINHTT